MTPAIDYLSPRCLWLFPLESLPNQDARMTLYAVVYFALPWTLWAWGN